MNKDFIIDNCAVILLAAGASVRLGTPKQLLNYKGSSFLKNMITVAKSSRLSPVIVVLGANVTSMASEITDSAIHAVHNEDWAEGIASSIRCGIRALEKFASATDAAVIMVCDQPFLTSSLLNDLLTAQQKTGKPIAAAYYDNTPGTPALFHKAFFQELLLLKGDKGAGRMLQQDDLVVTVPFPMGAVDVDTMNDYKKLDKID